MLARVLLFAAILSPLYAQDEDVTKYIEELRAPRPPRDAQAEQREILAALRQRLDSTTDPAQKAALELRISDSEQFLGHSDAAIAAARNARDLEPADDRVALGLAQVLIENGQTAELPALLGVDPSDGAALIRKATTVSSIAVAIFCAKLAHELLPGDPQAADTLGSMYLRNGAGDKALTAFRQASDLAPQVATYHSHLASAYLQRGLKDQALAEYQLALQSNPSDTERSLIVDALARLDAPRKE
jgi:tetratricopeptide (TPR) repeat protein